MISMNKKYQTRSGLPVRILCVDAKTEDYPVIGLISVKTGEKTSSFTKDGNFLTTGESGKYDLIEVSPYADFKVDEPVMVRDADSQPWQRRYFAKVDVDGNPTTWCDCATSWSVEGGAVIWWNQCRRPTPEELKG